MNSASKIERHVQQRVGRSPDVDGSLPQWAESDALNGGHRCRRGLGRNRHLPQWAHRATHTGGPEQRLDGLTGYRSRLWSDV